MTSPSARGTDPAGGTDPEPRLLCDARALADAPPLPAGVLWKLDEPGRQLDANVVRLAPGGSVAPHREPDLDVLLFVVAGSGVLGAGRGDEPRQLTPGTTVWLPHGSTRSLTAGRDGLTYLTVHRRRPGMQIRRRDDAT
ncbi:hypothetical protein [Streptomyces thermoalcalitolerans]|uniref:Cupin 2 conserved barrel domain-containing protein n=1 Tax=Streptomyces thermoalcalitolerans TaxID=65605 RepID=A0ABN1NJM2_9ACTN